jgi:CRP/FNR family cyclic AMP-dependent transcriptional regulator
VNCVQQEARHRTATAMSKSKSATALTPAETRSRVNFFMNKFRKLGFIECNGGLKINNSLLNVVLRD